MRQYGRDDVSYETWYSPHMKSLAKNYSYSELESRLYGAMKTAKAASRTHLRAIERTHSMTSNSTSRAHARNVVSAYGDEKIALQGALEIHELFPEHAKAKT